MDNKEIINLSWDEYFMGIAIFTSFRSKDPSSKVGTIIVNPDNHIIAAGYNGFVAGVDEEHFSWAREGDFLDTKYAFVVHAEVNAIINSTIADFNGCKLYATLFPCNECAKLIAQKNITDVYYLQDKYVDTEQHKATEIIFKAKGIKTHKLDMPSMNSIIDKFKEFYPENIN